VEFAGDGQAFVDRLAEVKPALAVLDLRMPGFDGMDILEHMHGHPIVSNLPIVVFSTGDPPPQLASLEHPSIREYVRKPEGFAEFPAAVARVIAHASPGK
jgi:CheY-like chemotaxis protein